MAKKVEKEVKSKGISAELKKLRAAAKDINETMGPIDGFEPDELNEAELKDSLKDLETQIPSDDESLSKETWSVLKELDLECARQRFAKDEEAPKKPAKGKKADKEEAEEQPEEEVEEAPKKGKKSAATKEEAEEEEVEKPAKKGPKKAGGVGVIASIPEILKAAPKLGISLEDVAKQLHKKFPDRQVSSLLGTVKVQVSSRLKKEKGINVITVSKGMYKI